MRLTSSRQLAAASALLSMAGLALPAAPARRPHYGGTLRVEIGASVGSIDPAAPPGSPDEAAAKRQIESLIYERVNADGSLAGVAGSGPFRISEWEPGKQLTLAANDDFAGGRPFVDTIEIDMGRAASDRLADLQLDRVDFAEIPAEDARQATARGIRVAVSQPDELIAVLFPPDRPQTNSAANAARLRQAIACSINREAIVDFILQKEGEPAGGLLPQWSSGTAFLFPTIADPVRAKELRSQIAGSASARLGYDSGDALAESIADRIAVDAREAGLAITPDPSTRARQSSADPRLVHFNMVSPHPAAALANLLGVIEPMVGMDVAIPSDADSAERIYAAQRTALDGFRIVPVVWLPRVYGLSDRVRDWQTPATGESWPLANVWLDTAPANGAPK